MATEVIKKRIYIAPQSGDYADRLLVLDHVESMAHQSTSIISSHPVESQNQNIADHRYHNGKIISLTGMLSDNTKSELVSDPTPIFQSIYFIEAKRLRAAVKQVPGDPDNVDKYTTEYVNKILDGFDDVTEKEVIDNVPESEQFYIAQANRILASDLDAYEEAKAKGMSVDKAKDNNAKINGVINSISEGKELLKSVDRDSTILTIQSIWDEYPNMVLKSWNNVLRNGPQRGAYWVNLSFEEELISEASEKTSIVSVPNSEEASSTEAKGKQDITTASATDENRVAVDTIYTQVLSEQVNEMPNWLEVNPNSIDKIKTDALAVYMKASAKFGGDVAETAAANNINTNMQVVANRRGKTSW